MNCRSTNALLVILGVFSFGVLIKIWVAPEWGGREWRPLGLPEEAQIDGWVLTGSQKMKIGPSETPRPAVAMEYRYDSNGITVNVEARSFVKLDFELADQALKVKEYSERGDVRSLVSGGWYLKQSAEEFTALDVCLDAAGRRTATHDQFAGRHREAGMKRLVNWVIGRGPLHDRRGAWLHLSLAHGPEASDDRLRSLCYVLEHWQSAWTLSLK